MKKFKDVFIKIEDKSIIDFIKKLLIPLTHIGAEHTKVRKTQSI